MANTYTWDCTTVDVYPSHSELTDVVYNVHWRLTATDASGEHSSTSIGTQMLSLETLQSEGFIPVADLTNEQVSTWVEEELGAERVAEIKTSLDNVLVELVTPSTVTMRIGGDE